MKNEVYEFSFERRQLMKVIGGLLSLVLLVFCAGLLVGVAFQLHQAGPALMAEATPPQPAPAAPAPAAEAIAQVVEPAEIAAEPVAEPFAETNGIDPDRPALEADEIVETEVPRPRSSETFAVQVGAFLQSENAGVLAKRLTKRGYEAGVVLHEDSRGRMWYLVRSGAFSRRAEAVAVAVRLHDREGLDAVVRPSNSM